jgi:hypothetical protein
LEQIFAARDAQLRGNFRLPAQMAAAMLTDDALSVAFENRLAPQRTIGVSIKPADDSRRALSVAAEADALYGASGIALTMATRLNVHGCLVQHRVAFLHLTRQVRDDGSRVDLFASYWPIEHVRWDEYKRCFLTTAELEDGTRSGAEVEIRHGDGEWIIIADREHRPWLHGAILPGALIWSRHAGGKYDWSAASRTHGNAKVMGELPEGVALQDSAGALTEEAASFLAMLQAVASSSAEAGIRPAGSKTDYLVNGSSAWQVWKELVLVEDRAAARVYLGTDGTLGAVGGAPGVDIVTLLGVASTLVQGDLETIERCLLTGLFEVWTAINFGDSTLAPSLRYQIPRLEEEAEVEALGKREALFFDALDRARALGLLIDQPWIDATAKRYRVTAPKLPEPTDPTATTVQP